MNINHDDVVDKNEFIEYVFKAFKNCEDNIEFLANDISDFDEKLNEVKTRLEQSKIKERKTGYKINGKDIMKDSTLTFNIIDGEFDDQFFPPDKFEPMIEILINENPQGTNSE